MVKNLTHTINAVNSVTHARWEWQFFIRGCGSWPASKYDHKLLLKNSTNEEWKERTRQEDEGQKTVPAAKVNKHIVD